MPGAVDDFEQFLQIFAGGFLAGEGAEEDGELRDEFLILEHVIRDAAGVHGGKVKESKPVLGALFKAELPGPGAEIFWKLGLETSPIRPHAPDTPHAPDASPASGAPPASHAPDIFPEPCYFCRRFGRLS